MENMCVSHLWYSSYMTVKDSVCGLEVTETNKER